MVVPILSSSKREIRRRLRHTAPSRLVIYGNSAGPGKALDVVQHLMKAKANELGFIHYIGSGTTTANALHAKDVSRFVLLVLSNAFFTQTFEEKKTAVERCYNIGGKVLKWKDVANAFAKAFFEKVLVEEAKAINVSLEEAGEREIPKSMASDQSYTFRRAAGLGFEVREKGLMGFLKNGDVLF